MVILIFDGSPIWQISIWAGIDICDNDEHPLKAESPISFTEEGIVICVNDEHSSKAEFPM